jgi:hypothetical protein
VVDDNATGRNLRLDNKAPRRRSEVQAYMVLYYDTKIRDVVLKRWAEMKLTHLSFKGSNISEDRVDTEDSSLLKDTTIPLYFKNLVAQELYDAEEEEVKKAVRSKRESDLFDTTIYNTSGEERMELVRAYQK